ncbi:MAG: division/cell wall cluster transcriptional repressor MraZ [Rubrivivax sp.]|nr:division/cell wall cluster transcriptional repressor MraZ [Rubrivivax sp.]
MLALDGKGRVTVPAKWRDQINEKLAGELVLCKDPAGCLGLYPPPVFNQLADVLMGLTGDDADEWRRLYLGSQNELTIDNSSRILLPPELRRWAGFREEGGSVVFMGVGAYFELWDPNRSEAREAQVIAKGKPEALRNLVLR